TTPWMRCREWRIRMRTTMANSIAMFFFNDTPTTEIYTLSLHDALPICLVTKEVAAKETVVLSVGQIQAGTKNNIIPDKAVMRGTLRTFHFDVRQQLLGRLQSFVADMARAYRAEARLDLTMGCPPVVNPDREADLVHR